MKNWIINALAKLGGVTKLWGLLDGYKTKIGGAATMLSGIAALLTQLVPIIESKDTAALLHFVQGIVTNPAWLAITGGLGILGIGHKIEKSDAAPVVAPGAVDPK